MKALFLLALAMICGFWLTLRERTRVLALTQSELQQAQANLRLSKQRLKQATADLAQMGVARGTAESPSSAARKHF